METDAYLRRIGVGEVPDGTGPDALGLLQRRHLLSVPFENLDIHLKRPIRLDPAAFYRKVVREGRGGFCYELNGLFRELLAALGFRTRIISARVSDGRGGYGAEFDHLTIIAEAGGGEYLVDVGFGDFTAGPIPFVPDREHADPNGVFAIFDREDEGRFEVAKRGPDGVWKSEFVFRDVARKLSEFEGMCEHHQTSPESHFTRGRVCSLMTETGRKTLTDERFIRTDHGRRTETKVGSEKEFEEILGREFSLAVTGDR